MRVFKYLLESPSIVAGTLRVDVNTPTGSFYEAQEYPDVSLGTPFGFSAGSQLLPSNTQQNWTCGSAGVMGGNIGAAIYIRKHEQEGKFKIDFQDIEVSPAGTAHPRRNPHRYGYDKTHHQPIEPWTVKVTWEENGKVTEIDTKQL